MNPISQSIHLSIYIHVSISPHPSIRRYRRFKMMQPFGPKKGFETMKKQGCLILRHCPIYPCMYCNRSSIDWCKPLLYIYISVFFHSCRNGAPKLWPAFGSSIRKPPIVGKHVDRPGRGQDSLRVICGGFAIWMNIYISKICG